MSLTHAYAGHIEKYERTDDGDLLVYGKATGPDLDLDEQVCDPGWLKKAMPDWARWSNLRAMHGAVAAGVGVETSQQNADDWWVKSLVTDKDSAHKVETGTYKGYSIGIKNARVVKDAQAPGGRIVGGTIVEISLVDRPCNPTATLMVAKSEGGELHMVDAAKAVLLDLGDDASVTKLADTTDPAPEPQDAAPAAADDAGAEEYDGEVTTPVQKAAAARAALVKTKPKPDTEVEDETGEPDDADEADGKRQAQADAGGAKTKQPAKKPATAGASKGVELDAWQRQRAEAYATKALAGQVNLHTLVTKDAAPDGDGNDESDDLATAAQILVLLGRLVCSEAEELAKGDFREAFDISVLMDMVNSLRCFIAREEDQAAGSFAPVDCDTVFVSLAAEPDLVKGKYSAEQLRQMLKDGKAIKNAKGKPSYPIGDKEDLDDAIKAVGRGNGDHDQIRSYIMRRAKALGATDMIPDNWASDGSLKTSGAKAATADTAPDTTTDILKDAAEAKTTYEELTKELEAELAKVRSTVIPGGPVLIAPTPVRREEDEHLAKAAQYRAMAERLGGSVARDYRALAAEEEALAKR